MNRLLYHSLLFGAGLLLCLSSCKKKDEHMPDTHVAADPSCRMLSMTAASGACRDSSVISYDAAGRISAAVNFNNCSATPVSQRRFIYDGGRVYILDTTYMADKDTLIVDAALRVLEIHSGRGLGGGVAMQFHFSAEGLLQSTTRIYQFMPPFGDTTRYYYENGDIVMEVTRTDTTKYSYYADKPIPATSLVTQYGLRYGSAVAFANRHLLKATLQSDGSPIDSYTYSYDGFGNIATKVHTNAASGTVADTTFYRYLCAVE